MSCIFYLRCPDSNTAYGHTKFANLAFTKELAKRLAKEQILAFTLHPGGQLEPLESIICMLSNTEYDPNAS